MASWGKNKKGHWDDSFVAFLIVQFGLFVLTLLFLLTLLFNDIITNQKTDHKTCERIDNVG